jgi:hypothetical protein
MTGGLRDRQQGNNEASNKSQNQITHMAGLKLLTNEKA